MNTVIMSGALGDFDVPSILQAVSLSRQYTLLRLWDSDKRETGEIRVKAGQLLDAKCGSTRGRSALHSLLQARHHSFRVERFADPVNLPDPVGTLAALLLEAPRPVLAPPSPPPPPPPVARAAEPPRAAMRLASVPGEPSTEAIPTAAADRLALLPVIEQLAVCSDDRTWYWARGSAGSLRSDSGRWR